MKKEYIVFELQTIRTLKNNFSQCEDNKEKIKICKDILRLQEAICNETEKYFQEELLEDVA